MRLLERKDQPGQERTLYIVSLDDGRVVTAERRYFPSFCGMKTFYILDGGIERTEEMAVWRFLRRAAPPNDFATAVFERRCYGSYAAIVETCLSLEQALYLANKQWEGTIAGTRWMVFKVYVWRDGERKEIIKDWLKSS